MPAPLYYLPASPATPSPAPTLHLWHVGLQPDGRPGLTLVVHPAGDAYRAAGGGVSVEVFDAPGDWAMLDGYRVGMVSREEMADYLIDHALDSAARERAAALLRS